MHDKESGLGGYSRFGRFGSQLFQKTVGRVLKSRPERQVIYNLSFLLPEANQANGSTFLIVSVIDWLSKYIS